MDRQDILNGVLIAAAIETFTIPAFGALSDRLGRRPGLHIWRHFLGACAGRHERRAHLYLVIGASGFYCNNRHNR